MKRKLFFIAAIVICLSLTAYGTLAFFTAEDTAHNVITTGDVAITLNDKIEGEGAEKTDNGWSITGVMPSQEVEKAISVTNTGKGDAWIRLKLTVTIKDAKNENFDLPTYIEKDGINTIDVVTWTLNDNWVKKGDYIYYKVPVQSGQTTENLFKDDIVRFAKEMNNLYQGCTVTIKVEAEAVQSANNGTTCTEATGWPTT